jgi:hypothetical protein
MVLEQVLEFKLKKKDIHILERAALNTGVFIHASIFSNG